MAEDEDDRKPAAVPDLRRDVEGAGLPADFLANGFPAHSSGSAPEE